MQIREIDRGTLARPRVGSIPGSPKSQEKKRFSVVGCESIPHMLPCHMSTVAMPTPVVPSAYEVPKWMTSMDEYSPPVPPRRTSVTPHLQDVSDTPPPLREWTSHQTAHNTFILLVWCYNSTSSLSLCMAGSCD